MKLIDKKLIGKQYPDISFAIEKQRLRFFSKATSQTDPIYFNEKFAKQKGYPSIVAPPTFLTTVGYEKENPFDFLDELGIEIDRVLSAGQNYIFYDLIFAGDFILMKSRISDIYDKKSGKLQFVEISSEFELLNFMKISQNFSKFLKLVAIIFKIHEF